MHKKSAPPEKDTFYFFINRQSAQIRRRILSLTAKKANQKYILFPRPKGYREYVRPFLQLSQEASSASDRVSALRRCGDSEMPQAHRHGFPLQ